MNAEYQKDSLLYIHNVLGKLYEMKKIIQEYFSTKLYRIIITRDVVVGYIK